MLEYGNEKAKIFTRMNQQPLPRIYIETSVISYLTARPSRDLLIAARQEATREWWEA